MFEEGFTPWSLFGRVDVGSACHRSLNRTGETLQAGDGALESYDCYFRYVWSIIVKGVFQAVTEDDGLELRSSTV
jgi:hypothetical protein